MYIRALLVSVVVVAASGCSSSSPSQLPPPGAGPSTLASSGASGVTAAPECTASDVRVVVATTGGFTAGMYFATLRVSSRSALKCALRGWANVTLLDTRQGAIPTRLVQKGQSHDALLTPATPVEWDILWSQVPGASPCAELITAGEIKVVLPGATPVTVNARPQSANNSGPPRLCGGIQSPLYESAFGTPAF